MFPLNLSSVPQIVDSDQDDDTVNTSIDTDNSHTPDVDEFPEIRAYTVDSSSGFSLSVFFVFAALCISSLVVTTDASPVETDDVPQVRSVNISRNYLSYSLYNLMVSFVGFLILVFITLESFLLSLSPQMEVHRHRNILHLSATVAPFLNMGEDELMLVIGLMVEDVVSIAREDGIVLDDSVMDGIIDGIAEDVAANVILGRSFDNRALLLRVVNARR
ncbi:putative membrane protein [Candidatus Ichthyocystis hellenicum]|uniref:Putative membrane protein n=1 Tax=Candidatus Ichthyocystis hellenicum TaxID=1561003 RepID=A0A0S4M661_9BURK|nr:hypothetical protein [Candidatus Ichthyocystis hellenicum]CUT17741.1 putative membrane protein [Candidatus Ichthyocystis hellenicum]